MMEKKEIKKKIRISGLIMIILYMVMSGMFYISEDVFLEYYYHIGIEYAFNHRYLIILVIVLLIPIEYILATIRLFIKFVNVFGKDSVEEVISLCVIDVIFVCILKKYAGEFIRYYDIFFLMFFITILLCIRFQERIKNYWICLLMQLIIAAYNVALTAKHGGFKYTALLVFVLIICFIGIYNVFIIKKNKKQGEITLIIGVLLSIILITRRLLELLNNGNELHYNLYFPYGLVKEWLGNKGFIVYILAVVLFLISGLFCCNVLKRYSVRRAGLLMSFILLLGLYFSTCFILDTGIRSASTSILYSLIIIPVMIRLLIFLIPFPDFKIFDDCDKKRDFNYWVEKAVESNNEQMKFVEYLENICKKIEELEEKYSSELSENEKEELEEMKERVKNHPSDIKGLTDKWNLMK